MTPDASFTLPGRFRAVVFDVDGLLVATEHAWAASETELLARRGLVFTEADRLATIGRSVDHSVEIYGDRIGMPVSGNAALRAELLEILGANLGSVAPRPGAARLVGSLAGVLPMAVASASPRSVVDAALAAAGLAGAFDAVVSGDDVTNPKPAPDPYLLACHRLGVDPGDAVAFEDSVPGIRAAVAAGMLCVAVPSPGVDPSAAHLVLPSLEAVVVTVPMRP
jgi:beta-phosphoglucomutase-like phosphatase (HAD superfamily)